MPNPPQNKPASTSSKALSPEALDFAPGLLSIQESPPARLPRAVLYTVSGLFAILLLWACFGKLDIIASADGRLVPRSYVKVVQPADAGIVKEILVHEGDSVQAGQVLLRMDPQDAEADARTLQTQMTLKSLQLRRVDAELAGKPLKRAKDDPDDLFQQVSAQYTERRQAYLDSQAQARDALTKAQHDAAAAKQVLAKLKQTNPILKTQADAYADLGKNGYAAKVQVGDKQREYLENEQDIQAQQATVASLAAAVAEAGKHVNEITSKYRSDLRNERIEADGDYRKLQQDWVKQSHKAALLELKAPQAGTVKDIAIHTVGTVVSAGTVLLSLVPENEPLVAEVMIRNDDVGFVQPQQRVKIKLAAYPFQKYGMLDGDVMQVWPDASDDSNDGSKDPANKSHAADRAAQTLSYKALIALNSQTLEARGSTLKLVPGMQVVAEINQGRRTVLEYLLSPVQKTLYESGRER
jgi:HlyD family secretion protein